MVRSDLNLLCIVGLALLSLPFGSSILACDDAQKDGVSKDRFARSEAEQKALLDRCKKMTRDEFKSFLAELAQRTDTDALRILAHHHDSLSFGDTAVTAYAASLSTDELLVLCCKSRLSSVLWMVYFHELSAPQRRKEDVIEYIKQIAISLDPDARAACYHVCARRKWDDLAAQAKSDVGRKERIAGPPNTYFGLLNSLGDAASYYLRILAEK